MSFDMMGLLSSELAWVIVGGVAGVIGTVVAIIESVKKKSERLRYQRLKRTQKNRTWGHIQAVLELYQSLEDARNSSHATALSEGYETYEAYLCDKITSARRGAVRIYLRLLEQAIDEEETFDARAAQHWKDTGKLENEWRYQMALKFVD
jgi:hypothetical protein